MSRTPKKHRTADEIADMATRGEDISAYFTNKFSVVRPVRRVNIDLTEGTLSQAAIKTRRRRAG